MEDEAARRRQAQKAHIELRLEEGRCVDCGNVPHPLSPFWSRCRACDSLICRTCRAKARNLPDSHVNKTWRCPGCGAGPDEEGRLHAGVYGSVVAAYGPLGPVGPDGDGGPGGDGGDGG